MMKSHFRKKAAKGFSLFKQPLNNQEGMALIVTLMVLVMLTISGVAAINITNNETNIVRNEQLVSSEFYNSESGINYARVNFNAWLDDPFLRSSETTAQKTLPDPGDPDALPLPVPATLQIRCIESSVTPIFGNVADQMPAMSHKASPPEGSGYSLRYFETRRYSITSTSNTGNTIVQTGVWKVFNKY